MIFVKSTAISLLIISGLTANDRPDINYLVARVIYGEASTISNYEARFLVASVITNRVNNKHFGGLKSVTDVVRQPMAFSAYRSGKNWEDTMNNGWSLNSMAWKEAMDLSRGDFMPDKTVFFFLTEGTPPKPNMIRKEFYLIKVKTVGGLDFYTYKPRYYLTDFQ